MGLLGSKKTSRAINCCGKVELNSQSFNKRKWVKRIITKTFDRRGPYGLIDAIVIVTRSIVLIEDINQLRYIDRENLFKMFYQIPSQSLSISENL